MELQIFYSTPIVLDLRVIPTMMKDCCIAWEIKSIFWSTLEEHYFLDDLNE